MRSLGLLGLLSLSFLTACAPQREASEWAPAGHAERRSEPPRDWSAAKHSSAGFAGDEGEAAGGTAPTAAPHAEESLGTRWDDGSKDFDAGAIAREHRPGLGTAFGETRSSSVDTVSFRRADAGTPDVVFAIRYDDVAGIRQVARSHRERAFSSSAMQRQGDLSFGLLDAEGHVLSAASVGSELYAVGEPESRYSLAVANDSNTTYEVVLSVDGLDVIDGRPAGFDKRGYVIDPFSSLVIDGWRTSEDTVAAFRFSSLDDSYAERTGEGRNVGVIGAAFFREAPRHWEEWRAPEDGWRRETADPFPGSR